MNVKFVYYLFRITTIWIKNPASKNIRAANKARKVNSKLLAVVLDILIIFCLYCKDPILFKMLSNLVLRGAKQPWDGEHPDLMEAVEAAVNSAEAAADAAAKPFWCSPCPFEPWIWRN